MVPYYQQLHRPIIPRGKQNWLASLIQVTLVPFDIVHSVKKKKGRRGSGGETAQTT